MQPVLAEKLSALPSSAHFLPLKARCVAPFWERPSLRYSPESPGLELKVGRKNGNKKKIMERK